MDARWTSFVTVRHENGFQKNCQNAMHLPEW